MLGDDDWPFPVPLVKRKERLDVRRRRRARTEIITRRVGQNELDAIQVCLGYFNAQRDYRARNPEGARFAHYADRLISSPGKRDGLYWPTEKGEPESPDGPCGRGRPAGGLRRHQACRPYRGYRYRILTAQGPRADGGARNYKVDGKLVDGFALVAYPAAYASSGVKTFLINQSGVVLAEGPRVRTPRRRQRR